MGPKKEPNAPNSSRSRKEEPGAKIANIIIGVQETPLVVKANLNCPLDMILDYVRVQFVKKLNGKLAKDISRNASIDETTEGSGTSTADLQNMSKFWIQFHSELSGEDVVLDLIDGNEALVDCQQDLKRNAVTGDVLVPFSTYTLAIISTDSNGQVVASPLLIRNGERTPPIVKGGAAAASKKK